MTTDVNSRGVGYPQQFGMLIGFTGAGVLIGTVVSYMVWKLMTHQPLPTSMDDMMKPQYFNTNMVMQAISTLFIFFIPVVGFASISYKRPAEYLGLNKGFTGKLFLLMLGILIITFPVSALFAEVNKMIPLPLDWTKYFEAMEKSRREQEEMFLQMNSFGKYLTSLFIIAVLPAIFEELFFRAAFQNLFTRWLKSPWTAIILTSVIFSIVHLSYFGFLTRFALGITLGVMFYYSGSIWLNMIFHMLFNGVQVTALYLLTLKGGKAPSPDIESHFPMWSGLMALLVLVFLLHQFIISSEAVHDVRSDL
jgi:uncharacterized protein